MRKFKRYFSLLLAIVLVASAFPLQVSAAPELSVSVDWNDEKANDMEGIGAAYAFNKSHGLMQLAEIEPETAAHLIDLIYDSENGVGQTLVRTIVGDGGVRSVGSAARPGYNPINGLRADGSKPGFDVEGNKIPMSTRIYANSTAARDDNGSSASPGTGVTLADPGNSGFATNGTALYGAYGYTMNDWGNRHYDGASDTIWPNEGKYDEDGKLVSGYGFVWELPGWNEPVPGDTGGFTNDFTGKGEINVVDRPRTMKELFDVDQIWVMRQAKAYGVDTFYACAWSAPYWMKTNMSIFGQDQGSADYLRAEVDENGSKIYFQAYADYLAALVYGYWTEFGAPITHVGAYNEAESTHGYSGMRSRNAAEVITLQNDYILPTFAEKFGEGGIYHNAMSPDGEPLDWVPEIVIGDGTSLNTSFNPSGTSYTASYFADAANAGKVTASTHFYGTLSLTVNARTWAGLGANPLSSSTTAYLKSLENYSIWQTEYANGDGNTYPGAYGVRRYYNSIDDAIRWSYLMSNCFNSDPGFNAFLHWWNIGNNGSNASDLIRFQTTGSPQAAGGSSITGTYHIFKRFYAFGHYSRFIRNGDIHIGSAAQLGSYLNSVAYKRPDGSDFSVTLTNADYEAKTVSVSLQNFDGYKGNLGSVTVFRTTDSENMKKVGTVPVTGNTLTIEMPAQSIITLVPSDGEYASYNGLDGERDLYSSYEATESDDVIGTPSETTGANGFPSVSMKNGDSLVYSNINFADGSGNGSIARRHLLYIMANIESAPSGGILRAYVAEPGAEITDPAAEATYVGEIIIPKDTSSSRLANVTSNQTTGTRSTRIDTGDLGAYMCKDLYLVASGENGSKLFSISRFRFDSADDSGSPTPTAGNITSGLIPASVGVLTNGDFETANGSANTAGWTAIDSTLTAVNTQTYSGLVSPANSTNAFSAMLSGRGAGSGMSQALSLTAGEIYTFRGMFMPTVDGATASAEIVYSDANGTEIRRDTIARREGLDLLPEREGGVRPKEPGTAAGSFGDLNIPIAGIPMNMTAVNPTKFRPSGWYEVTGKFTYNPPEGTASAALVLSDNTTATLYIDEVTLASTPDRDKLLAILNTSDVGSILTLKNEARSLYTSASATQAAVNSLMARYSDYDSAGFAGTWTGEGEITLTWESIGSNAVLLVDGKEYEGWSADAVSPYVIKGLSPEAHTFTIGSATITVGINVDIPALKVTSDKYIIMNGNYFNIETAFEESVNSNALVMTCKYDSSKFDYRGFTPAGGFSLVNTVSGEDSVRLTLAKLDGYGAEMLGSAMFSVKEGVNLENAHTSVDVSVEFVNKGVWGKTVLEANGSVAFKTIDDEIITNWDLIDLSNIIDLFGVKKGDELWGKAEFFDFNGNDEIDISDISYVAQRII